MLLPLCHDLTDLRIKGQLQELRWKTMLSLAESLSRMTRYKATYDQQNATLECGS